ncbi:MAG: SMP-30/gluconolactonase/LRE family protein, partial [Anderseniella sp.]
MMEVFDSTPCTLGEGPLWHPERGQLFWFDIIGKTLFCREGQTLHQWRFDENVSAAGWVDRDTLLIASETGLFRFDIETGRQCLVQTLEADNAATRSNDGRADPWGGFWIGTMGKNAEPKAGAIYR